MICRVGSKTCVMDARRLWRLPSSVKWVARAAPHLPASPKGSLYISRAFAILNVILLSSKLRTNKIGVYKETITTKASLGGSSRESWQCSLANLRACPVMRVADEVGVLFAIVLRLRDCRGRHYRFERYSRFLF